MELLSGVAHLTAQTTIGTLGGRPKSKRQSRGYIQASADAGALLR